MNPIPYFRIPSRLWVFSILTDWLLTSYPVDLPFNLFYGVENNWIEEVFRTCYFMMFENYLLQSRSWYHNQLSCYFTILFSEVCISIHTQVINIAYKHFGCPGKAEDIATIFVLRVVAPALKASVIQFEFYGTVFAVLWHRLYYYICKNAKATSSSSAKDIVKSHSVLSI